MPWIYAFGGVLKSVHSGTGFTKIILCIHLAALGQKTCVDLSHRIGRCCERSGLRKTMYGRYTEKKVTM
jgi:hypothetical protein